MAITHTNRCGDTYYLQCGVTRTGKPSYSFTRKLTKTPVDEVPEGFEIYENPENAQVFLRKAKPSSIWPEEREQVEESIRTQAGLEHFIVGIDGDSLVVYLPGMELEQVDRALGILMGPFAIGQTRGRDLLIKTSNFTKMMRFMLADKRKRLFTADRWCFRGSIDNWWSLAGLFPLPKLLAKYVPHLGKQSFYDLM